MKLENELQVCFKILLVYRVQFGGVFKMSFFRLVFYPSKEV